MNHDVDEIQIDDKGTVNAAFFGTVKTVYLAICEVFLFELLGIICS